tara:strand:- start:2788 stop:2988 length:201 start_codon:yes stop_codon:yes gene_type:complete
MKKKLWKKTNIVADIGDCRYCGLNIISTDSFVAFLSVDEDGQRHKAHYECMKRNDYKKIIEKEKHA